MMIRKVTPAASKSTTIQPNTKPAQECRKSDLQGHQVDDNGYYHLDSVAADMER